MTTTPGVPVYNWGHPIQVDPPKPGEVGEEDRWTEVGRGECYAVLTDLWVCWLLSTRESGLGSGQCWWNLQKSLSRYRGPVRTGG